ncbi:MAG: hypothetical protein LBB23_04750 [Rickettsiales bacterium]|jgi:hypothetical protein|nr:hypothetical protein [Rickettsiales bacterium]
MSPVYKSLLYGLAVAFMAGEAGAATIGGNVAARSAQTSAAARQHAVSAAAANRRAIVSPSQARSGTIAPANTARAVFKGNAAMTKPGGSGGNTSVDMDELDARYVPQVNSFNKSDLSRDVYKKSETYSQTEIDGMIKDSTGIKMRANNDEVVAADGSDDTKLKSTGIKVSEIATQSNITNLQGQINNINAQGVGVKIIGAADSNDIIVATGDGNIQSGGKITDLAKKSDLNDLAKKSDLEGLAKSSDVYNKTEVYTKAETNTEITNRIADIEPGDKFPAMPNDGKEYVLFATSAGGRVWMPVENEYKKTW